MNNGNDRQHTIQHARLEQWPGFNAHRGTGPEPFAQRVARARLLYLRRREAAANWLALGVLLAAWHVEAGLERAGDVFETARDANARSIPQQPGNEPYWLTRSGSTRSWISRALQVAAAGNAARPKHHH